MAIDTLPEEFDRHDDLHILEEFDYGGGRTDIVIAGTSDSYFRRRTRELGLTQPIHKREYLSPFLILKRLGKRTYDYFREYCEGLFDVRKAVNWLLSNGFVVKEDNKIRTAPNLRRHVTTSYAIELKLKDWKRGLEQAARAKSYSEYQFVALDSEFVHRAKNNLEEFNQYNVGIISISPDWSCDVVHHPDRENQAIPTTEWSLNETVFSRQKN